MSIHFLHKNGRGYKEGVSGSLSVTAVRQTLEKVASLTPSPFFIAWPYQSLDSKRKKATIWNLELCLWLVWLCYIQKVLCEVSIDDLCCVEIHTLASCL